MHPAGPARAARYTQVEKLLVERNSQRSIVRATGVSRMTVAKLVKKAVQAAPLLPRRRPKEAQRKRCGVLARKSCPFSKKLEMHAARIPIVVDNYNLTLH